MRIDLRLGADGRFNLPAGGTSEAPVGAGPPVLPLRISLRDVAVEVSDPTHGLEAHVGGISLQATGSRLETAGTLDIQEPLRWRVGSQTGEVEFTPAYFRLGRALTFEKWSARSKEATVRLQGTWSDLFGANGLALTFDADLDLRRLAARAETPPEIDGSLRLEGRISGALGEPQADLTWRSDDTRAGGHRMKLAGHAALTGRTFDLGSASVMIAGGSLEGSGHVGFAPATASRFEAHGKGLDLASLLAPDGDRPGHPSVRSLLAGQVRASWPGLEWRRAHAQAVVEASAAGTDEKAGLPVEGEARLDLRGGKWTVEARAHSRDDARLAGQLGGELGSQDLGATSVSGRFDLEAPGPRAPDGRALGPTGGGAGPRPRSRRGNVRLPPCGRRPARSGPSRGPSATSRPERPGHDRSGGSGPRELRSAFRVRSRPGRRPAALRRTAASTDTTSSTFPTSPRSGPPCLRASTPGARSTARARSGAPGASPRPR